MRKIIGALMAAVLLTSMAAHAAPRSETKRYAGEFETGVSCNEGGTGLYIGGACFDLVADDEGLLATVTVADDYFPGKTGGLMVFEDADGNLISSTSRFFCNSDSMVVPNGAVKLVVSVNTAINLILECSTVSPATTGTITMDLTEE